PAGPPGADAGATRGVRVEARGRVAVRGNRPTDGRDGGLAQDADAPGVRPAAGRIGGAPMTREFHLLVKRLLDGELTLGDLPLELRPEGEEALRLLAALNSTPVKLSPLFDARVMATVRRRAGSPATARESFRAGRAWRWRSAPRDVEIRLRVRPWALGAMAAAAVLAALVLGRPSAPPARGAIAAFGPTRPSALVRFVLYAPGAHRVAIAGTRSEEHTSELQSR